MVPDPNIAHDYNRGLYFYYSLTKIQAWSTRIATDPKKAINYTSEPIEN
jgi:hypothetical protein